MGRLADAEKSHREYLQRHPSTARAANDLADVLLALGNYDETVAVLDPFGDDVTALVRRGVALSCLRRFEEARDVLGSARAQDPDEVARFARHVAPEAELDALLSPRNIFFGRGFMALGDCDWSGWSGYVAEMRQAAASSDTMVEPAVAFMMLHLPLEGGERRRIAERVAAPIEARTPVLPPPEPRTRSRIRVGILSPDFREHLNAYLLLPLFELADRERFEIHAYSLLPDDGSAIRARVRAGAAGFHDLHSMNDRDAAMAIRRADIDLLLDVGGHTTGGRFAIVAQRPARVQAAYLAFPGSLGSRRLDFAIVDRVIASPGPEWSEELVYLPHCFFLYDYRASVPQMDLARQHYGLPRDAFVYCAFHKAEKITPDTFDLWMAILREAPGSVLWLRQLSDAAVRNLRKAATERGVDARRLVFAPFESRDRYIARQRLGDLFLDAVHHNALTSACDALGAGLPVLTLRGSTMTTRGAESILRAAGLPELVAADQAEFVRLAVDLPKVIREIKGRVDDNRRSAPLFDTSGRVRDLEACFEEMLQVSDQSRSRL